ncbi:hypothetical protein BDN70DRAFT_905013 [Pholiota conissans]|uniref:Protein-S-isoprenylcysteine O-methyltransferase n=1 Tax=Pholiota conissans TaxID=109636 RepID=A0A9P5Z6X3_9AGAR|nr:hypothetical protein BDN70DRAFT_905013 [Pholiota conissans]
MSLAKIPLSILFAWAFKACLTPPQPPVPKSEIIVKGGLNQRWYFYNVLAIWAPLLQLTASLAETAMILAHHYPSSPVAKSVLAALTFHGGSAAALRLTPVNFLGGMMMIVGTLLRVLTYRYLGKFFRFEASIQKDHQLVTGGPYSIVRHPSYTGLIIANSGWFLWQLGDGSWVRASGLWNTAIGKLLVTSFGGFIMLGTLCLTLGRMAAEDRALQKTFGKQWDDWASRVRYMVVPGIY